MTPQRLQLPGPLRSRLAQAISLSLCLHLAVLGLIQIVPIRPNDASVVIEAWLNGVEQAITPLAADKTVTRESSHAQEAKPLPEPMQEATAVAEPEDRPADTAPAMSAVGMPETTHTNKVKSLSKAAVVLPAMEDMQWYGPREVDMLPAAKNKIEPLYPEAARLRGQVGSVKLRLRIDTSGEVEEVEVIESVPPGVFDAVTVAAFERAVFEPARRSGRPVRYEGNFRVVFELD